MKNKKLELNSFFPYPVLLLVFVLLLPGTPLFADHKTDSHKPAVHDTADTVPPAKAVELETVVVTGEKLQEYIRKNPSQIVSMGAAEIKEKNFLAVSEALGSMSGVDVPQGSSGLGTRIAIRGGGGSGSVLVLIDGRPAAQMQYGGVDLSSLPIDVVKRITVFKPPVPVWLGPGSSAGAIYIETNKNSKSRRFKNSGRIKCSAGVFGEAYISATGRLDSESVDIMIAAGAGRKDGKRTNSQKNHGHLNLHLGTSADRFDFEINSRLFVSEHGISGPTYNPTPNADQRYEKAGVDIKLSGVAGESMDYEAKAFWDVKDLSDRANTGMMSDLTTHTAGAGMDLFFTGESDDNECRTGVLCTRSDVDHTLSGRHDRTQFSLNSVYNTKLAPFRLTAGLRADYSDDFDFSPGAHAVISLEAGPDTILKFNAGYSENIPSFSQLYQPSHGSIDQVRGNPDLKKEKIVALNIGFSHGFSDACDLEVNLFRTQTDDLIKYQRGIDLISRPENISKAVKQGVETSMKFDLPQKTGIDISYIWQDTENRQNDKRLSFAPRHTVKLTGKKTFGTGTRVTVLVKGVSEQYTDTANTESQKLDAYVTTQAGIVHPMTLLGHKTEWFVQVKNLFDEDFSSHYGYPDDGLRLKLGFTINF